MAFGYIGVDLFHDGDDETDGIDEDCGTLATPLLPDGPGDDGYYSDDYHEDIAQALPRKSSSIGKLLGSGTSKLGGGRRKRGLCPICREPIRSGAHVCTRAQWEVQEGQLADCVRNSGNSHFRARRYTEAVEAYSRALKHSPEDARLWSNRSAAYALHGKLDDAMADAEATIRVAPSWFKGYFRKARYLEMRKDWDNALVVYELALEKCTSPEEQTSTKQRLAACRARRTAYFHVQNLSSSFSPDLVRERWRYHCAVMPKGKFTDSERCLRCLKQAEQAKAAGNREVSQQRWEEAARSYARGIVLLKFAPEEPSEEQARLEAALMLNIALCESHAGRFGEVLLPCRTVLELDPANVKARFRLASALGELQDYDSALQELEVALALQPVEAAVLALKRKLLQERQALKMQEKQQASRMFRKPL